MRELLVHIADKENDQMVNELENIYMLEHLKSAGKDASDLEVRHNFSRNLATKINERTKKQDPIIPELRSLVLDYSARLKKAGIRDWLLKKENKNASTLPALILKTILFIAGIPIWICGLITNYAPYFLSWKLAKKLTREIEWFAAVSMLIGTFAFQIWYLLIISIVWAFTDWKIMLITMVATVFSGWFSLHFSAFRKKLLGAWRFFSLKRNKNWLREISDKRDQIIQISKSIIQEQ